MSQWTAASDADPFDLDGDRLREECGVFGIFGHPDAAAITALGLHALQHRGQEAAGIVSFDGKRFHSERRMGLVGDTFSRREVIDRLPGMSAVGHVRYSTTGETILRNVQPLFAELDGGGFAIGHNGNLTNGLDAAPPARARRRDHAVDHRHRGDPASRRALAPQPLHRPFHRRRCAQLEGAYAFVGLTNKKLIGARDPLGIRPLVIGELDGCPILASETCALDIIGAKYVRDVENGEVVVFDEDGHALAQAVPADAAAALHLRIHLFRAPGLDRRRPPRLRRAQDHGRRAGPRSAGRKPTWWCRCRIPACRPRSAMRRQSGIPYELGIIRNHYVGRTFIQPTQSIRELGVRLKHSANRAVVDRQAHRADRRFARARHDLGQDRADDARGRRKRGAYPHRLAADHPSGLLRHRHARARQAARRHPRPRRHAASSSAPTRSPSCRSRAFTAPWATTSRDPVRPQFTDHCFTGDYPTPLTDRQPTSPPAATLAPGRGELTRHAAAHAFPHNVSCSKRAVDRAPRS